MFEEFDMCWADDVGDVIKAGVQPVVVNNTAPEDLVLEDFISFKPDSELSQSRTWLTQDLDLSLFGNLPELGQFLEDELPNSPDSGVPCSPDVSLLSCTSSAQSLAKESPPASPESGVCSPISIDSQESPASFTTTEVLDPASAGQLYFPETITLPAAASADLSFIEALWQDTSDPAKGDVVIASPVTIVEASGASTCGRIRPAPSKAKSTASKPARSMTGEEKRERKRAQNKQAATRYREKKRAESHTIYTEQTKLEGENKNLQDKFNQITREMQYLKELLIEVYRTKGLIE